jgi:hypothetical protein
MASDIGIIIQTLIAIITIIIVYRRLPFQNSNDGASAIKDYRDTTVSVQTELKAVKDEYRAIKEFMAMAHLTVTLGIPFGEKPEVLDYLWTKREEKPFVKDEK